MRSSAIRASQVCYRIPVAYQIKRISLCAIWFIFHVLIQVDGVCLAGLAHALRMNVLPLHQVQATVALARDTCSQGNQVVFGLSLILATIDKGWVWTNQTHAPWESQTRTSDIEAVVKANKLDATHAQLTTLTYTQHSIYIHTYIYIYLFPIALIYIYSLGVQPQKEIKSMMTAKFVVEFNPFC